MTEAEFDKYVAKIAATIHVPECPVIRRKFDKGWVSVAVKRKRRKPEPVKAAKPVIIEEAPVVSYVRKSYSYKGKIVKRRFIK